MTPLARLSGFVLLAACAAAPARADLQVQLNDPAPARSAATPAPKKPAGPAAPKASASRGSIPVLPDARPGSGVPETAPANEVSVNAHLGKALAPATDVYRLPDPRSQWVGKIKQNDQVAIVSQWQGWWCIVMSDGTQAYVPQTHVELQPFQVKTVVLPAPAASAPAPAPSQPEAGLNPVARAVLSEAFRYEGTKYVWGGNSQSGIDCSGLVKNCFSACGIQLPRRAGEQAEIGQPVPLDQLQPGDRLYFSVKKTFDHTGIYVGNGYFIHASMSRGKVGVDHLSTPLFGDHLAAARR